MKRENTKQYDLPEGSERVYDDQGRRAWRIPGLSFLVASRREYVMHVLAVKELMKDGDHWKPGMQIAYVPDHAEGKLEHPDVEFGFVTSVWDDDGCFCRYWAKGEVGKRLRTLGNSEPTYFKDLVRVNSVHQVVVNEVLATLMDDAKWIDQVLHGDRSAEGPRE